MLTYNPDIQHLRIAMHLYMQACGIGQQYVEYLHERLRGKDTTTAINYINQFQRSSRPAADAPLDSDIDHEIKRHKESKLFEEDQFPLPDPDRFYKKDL